MKARHPNVIHKTEEERGHYPFNQFLLTDDHVLVCIEGNKINDTPLWRDMLKWCETHLEDDDWSATELCTEYLAVGGCNCDIFYVGATPNDDYKSHLTMDELFKAMRETTAPANNGE